MFKFKYSNQKNQAAGQSGVQASRQSGDWLVGAMAARFPVRRGASENRGGLKPLSTGAKGPSGLVKKILKFSRVSGFLFFLFVLL